MSDAAWRVVAFLGALFILFGLPCIVAIVAAWRCGGGSRDD